MSKKIRETAAAIEARIASLKAKLAGAPFAERAELREEITQLELRDYPEAAQYEHERATQSRADRLAQIETELRELGEAWAPMGARRNELEREYDGLVHRVGRGNTAAGRALAKVLPELCDVWDAGEATERRGLQLIAEREQLQRAQG